MPRRLAPFLSLLSLLPLLVACYSLDGLDPVAGGAGVGRPVDGDTGGIHAADGGREGPAEDVGGGDGATGPPRDVDGPGADGDGADLEDTADADVPCTPNACGGCGPIEAVERLGELCGPCGGRWVCEGADGLTCDRPANACGGCDVLTNVPGAPCGDCGQWACDGPDAVICQTATLACDDGDASTSDDRCVDGLCRGAPSALDACGASCGQGCGEEGCCTRFCDDDDGCGDCADGCACRIACDDEGCDDEIDCQPDSTCHVAMNEARDGRVRCEAGASCTQSCNSADRCSLDCRSGAICAMACNSVTEFCEIKCSSGALCFFTECNSASCTIDCGAPTMCEGGVVACDRPCPESL